jgi:hypothetical protein
MQEPVVITDVAKFCHRFRKAVVVRSCLAKTLPPEMPKAFHEVLKDTQEVILQQIAEGSWRKIIPLKVVRAIMKNAARDRWGESLVLSAEDVCEAFDDVHRTVMLRALMVLASEAA